MTKEEWVEETEKALIEAGFKVFTAEEKEGNIPLPFLPWVKHTTGKNLMESIRFIKFRLPYGGCKTFYQQGIIIIPPGMRI